MTIGQERTLRPMPHTQDLDREGHSPDLTRRQAAPDIRHASASGGADMTQTVIIVDDNLLCARLYKAMLEPIDCRVLVARTAAEAARLLHPTRDEDLPDAEGGASLPIVAGAPMLPRPLFLVAAHGQAEPAQRVASMTGGDAVLVRKPVARDGLTSLVRRHLFGRH